MLNPKESITNGGISGPRGGLQKLLAIIPVLSML